MLGAIRHRGPDDQGFHREGDLAIGMRRLSIIDLSTGNQPIPNEDSTMWIVFNGEIYNHLELRRELEAYGHRFRTHSDTETILHLYEQFGPAAVSRLRGMFAFAIWNSRERTLFLARDRFGKKPLYYSEAPSGFFFGSEIKCLRAAGVPLAMNRDALRVYFQFGFIPDPLSAFEGVAKLPPACWMERRANGNLRTERYWTAPVPLLEEPPEFDGPANLAALRETFDESVRLRLMADVPLGAFLSGGIDSSLVVASMARQTTEPVKTFSIGFEEAGMNELPWARMVAEKYGTEHHEILVKPDSTAMAHRIAHHCDEPFGDSSAIPTGIVSEFAARHVKVALSGDGGDELFGGYTRFWEIPRLEAMGRVPGLMRAVLGGVAELLPYSAYGKNYLRMMSRPSGFERYLERNFAPYYLRRQLLTEDYLFPAESAFLDSMFRPYLAAARQDTLGLAYAWETNVNLPGDMLVKVDRMSMAYSLEVRCPLLDPEVARAAAGFPDSWRTRNGRGKYNLIASMQDRLPAELLTRPKSGFGIPLADWFRGSLRPLVQDSLFSRRFLDRGIVSEPFLRRMVEEHQVKRRDNSQWLWWLLMLELWFEEYPVSA